MHDKGSLGRADARPSGAHSRLATDGEADLDPGADPREERNGALAEEAGYQAERGDHHHEEMPRVRFTRRRLLASIAFVVSVAAFLYFVLPKLLGLRETWNRIQHGNAWWLALAALLEVFSFLGYVALFRVV